MSLQRGSYGIEFDGRQGSPLRKLWVLLAGLPVLAAALMFFRGCSGVPARVPEDGESVGQTRYRSMEVETERERPSLFRHFLNLGGRKKEQSSESASDLPDPSTPQREVASVPARGVQAQSQEVKRLLAQVTARQNEDDWVGARGLLLEVLLRPDAEEVRAFAEREISQINSTLLFSDRPMPEKVKHRVVAGDVISRLARQYGNTTEYILQANGIDRPDRLRIGQEIWLLREPTFELIVQKHALRAILTLNNQFCKSYSVGLGREAEVPSGTYVIRAKVDNPVYRAPNNESVAFGHPQNILGTRWVALSATGATPKVDRLGLHGVWQEVVLGQVSDEGWIYFRNKDIEELCVLLPTGTAVDLVE